MQSAERVEKLGTRVPVPIATQSDAGRNPPLGPISIADWGVENVPDTFRDAFFSPQCLRVRGAGETRREAPHPDGWPLEFGSITFPTPPHGRF
jgi:hypothetical protein